MLTYLNNFDDYAILFDNETSGLDLPGNAPLADQPNIIEFAGIKVNWKTLEEVERLEFMCKPPAPISDVITNITGIRNSDLADKKPFVAHFSDLQKFYFGTGRMIAHNVGFDRNMLSYEIRRLGKMREFPWPMEHICTVERSYDIEGKRLKQGDLYYKATGKELKGAHRAMADVEGLYEIVKYLRKEGKL